MNNSSVERVQKQMLWMMGGCFIWLTYSHFQNYFQFLISYFKLLPSWWLLVLIPIFTLSVVWSIHLNEKEIREAEDQWMESQQRFLDIERQFRLIKTNFLNIAPSKFIYYCMDLLKVLGYQKIQLINSSMLQVTSDSGVEVLVYAVYSSTSEVFHLVEVEKLIDKMKNKNIQSGIFMTTGDLSEEAKPLALSHGIQCYNGEAISKLVWLAIEEYKEKAQIK